MRFIQIRQGLTGGALLLAACVADAQPPGETAAAGDETVILATNDPPPRHAGTLGGYEDMLQRVSCPPSVPRVEPEPLAIRTGKVALQGINPMRTTVGALELVGGFHIISGDKRFGGLSGIDARDDGGLLAVSDAGDFVWLDLAEDGVTPVSARIAAMLDEAGAPMRGKAEADSEGLAVVNGRAFVSFEGNHRVLAYGLEACGAAARGAPIVTQLYSRVLKDVFAEARIDVGGNEGAEALAVTDDLYLFAGLETKVGKASPVSARPVEAASEFDLAIGVDAPELVGMDILPAGEDGLDVRVFSLHRSRQALASNAITIVETVFERVLDQTNLPARRISDIDERSHYRFEVKSSRMLAEMSLMLTIDNYEGIAAKQMPDGSTRLFVVSDDNFSRSQRTLLMVFDVK